MKKIIVLLAALVVAGFWVTSHLGSARAEQGCSDGFYPGGNQPGGQICVPIPGYGTSGDAPDSGERWENRWGAIATAPSGKAGASADARSKRAAEAEAVNKCKQKGGEGCEVTISYRNSCGALAWGSGSMTAARAGTLEMASRMALESCGTVSSECQIFYSNCSFPVRVR